MNAGQTMSASYIKLCLSCTLFMRSSCLYSTKSALFAHNISKIL
jgi:hypothetical protein